MKFKDRVLIMLYEVECVLKTLAYSYLALLGIKVKSSDVRIDFTGRVLLVMLLVFVSLLIMIKFKYDELIELVV